MFKRVSAVVLFVQDFDDCLKFYRDTLGLQVVLLESDFAAFKMDDQDFAIQGMETSAQMVNLKVDAFEPQSGKVDRVLLCTRVENVDNAYATLKAKGVEFTGPPEDKPWGIRVAYFRDPEGNIWEIAHPLDA
ncbi:MAG: VOC family protein [Chloroflexi bacterium]|nr:VOC family protein [Chloroflexota bacterium]